ncbi:hypothetical protein H1R20_g8439, partial [Candolleomyces eurysporus]
MVDSLAFDLCGDLKSKEGVAEQDQCPSGTRVCLTQVNVKENEPERIVSVVPLAQSSKLEPKVTVSPKPPQFLTILFHGSDYPQSPAESTPSIAQSFNLTLWCDPQIASPNITIEAYDGSQLRLTYFGPAGCPQKNSEGGGGGDTKKPDDGKEEASVGSGIGLFFLLLLLAFLAYFAIGAYYNYSTYGARGLDLLPIEAAPQVNGLNYALHQSFDRYADAFEIWDKAERSGWIEVLGGLRSSPNPTRVSSRPLGPSVSLSALEDNRRSSNSLSSRTHYVVIRGREPGVYTTWIEASMHVRGVPDAVHQSFNSRDEAWRVYENARLRVSNAQPVAGAVDSSSDSSKS